MLPRSHLLDPQHKAVRRHRVGSVKGRVPSVRSLQRGGVQAHGWEKAPAMFVTIAGPGI